MEPPVALVSAANTTPSYQKRTQSLVILVKIMIKAMYIEDAGFVFPYLKYDTANGGTSLHCFDGLRHAS
jgi:hypothetical protein